MQAVSFMQVPPAVYPIYATDNTIGRMHYLPGRIPSIEQILQSQPMVHDHAGDEGAERLLAALKRDNQNLEQMLERLVALNREI